MPRLLFFLKIFLFTLLIACSGEKKLSSVETSTLELGANASEDSAVLAIIQPYKKVVDKEMNEVLVISNQPLMKGEPEGALGNLIADIILKEGTRLYKPADNIPVSFCLLNNGGLRIPLPKGDITRGHIFELMPFDNEMVVITLTGAKTKELLDFIAARNGMPVAGLKMGIKDKVCVNP